MKKIFKKYMIAGTLVLVPVVATIWILRALIVWLDSAMLSFVPRQIRPQELIGHDIPGIGLLMTIIIILLTGIFTRLYIGKKFVKLGDAIFDKVPFGRAIYQAFKKVLHTAFSDEGHKSRKVVLVEYPKAGTYALAFVTGEYSDGLATQEGEKNLMVFVPTAPNPTSGFLLILPEKSVIDTNMSAEEASKLLISGGLLAKKTEMA